MDNVISVDVEAKYFLDSGIRLNWNSLSSVYFSITRGTSCVDSSVCVHIYPHTQSDSSHPDWRTQLKRSHFLSPARKRRKQRGTREVVQLSAWTLYHNKYWNRERVREIEKEKDKEKEREWEKRWYDATSKSFWC